MLRVKDGKGHWYFRYTKANGRRDTIPLGPYVKARTKADDDRSSGASTLVQARERAAELASMLRNPATADIRSVLDQKRRHAEAARELEELAIKTAAEEKRLAAHAKTHTVSRLCEFYVQYLKARKKTSYKVVQSTVRAHVDKHPLGERPAREATRSEFSQLLRQMAESGLRRQPGQLRGYLHAAYALAITAESDVLAPSELIGFRIDANPIAGIKAMPSTPRDRHLSAQELKCFLVRLAGATGLVRDVLYLCLLGGGQRPLQVLRAPVVDYDQEAGTLRVIDPKGRRAAPRNHHINFGPRGRRIMAAVVERAKALNSPHLFSITGKNVMGIEVLTAFVAQASKDMVAAGEAVAPFQMKDLRRTVETMLVGLKVSKDLRAQIQSHGLNGIQDRVYDQHDYAEEKRKALTKWERRISEIESESGEDSNAKVVPIR